MKDDYLWDKTGEPDPEIEHMERLLGGLRYKGKAHDLPSFEIKPSLRVRRSPRMLAIAAAIAFAILALGALAALMRQPVQDATENTRIVMASPVPVQQPSASPDAPAKAEATETVKPLAPQLPVSPSQAGLKGQPLLARRRSSARSRENYANERMEGMIAKERLIKALQITTSKLDFVRKNVKGEPKRGPLS